MRRALLALVILLLSVLAACAPPTMPPYRNRVTLVADGTRQRLDTDATTVQALLDEVGVVLSGLDRVTPAEVTAIHDGMTVSVVRVLQETYTVTQTLPFERQVVRDATVPDGESRLLQSGQPGTQEREYRITYEDGQETERVLLRDTIVQEPRDEIRLIGAKPQLMNTPITGTLAYLGNQDAWVMRRSSFERRRLTQLGDLDGRVFSLSHDGQRLLFTRTATETDHLNGLWLVRTTEASPNPVALGLQDVLWADWAPDDRALAWTTAEVVEPAPGWRGINDLWRAVLTENDLLTARREVLEPEAGGGYGWWGTRYAWSPAGDLIAYSRPESVGLVEIASGERAELIRFPGFRTFSSWAWNPALTWSPDGQFLAGAVHIPNGTEAPEESPVFSIVMLEAAGAYSATLATESGMWATPRFSPDGECVLFGRAVIPYQSATSFYALYLIDRDGSDQRLLLSHDAAVGIELPQWTWSPDGTTIAFVRLGDVRLLAVEDLLSGEARVEELVEEAVTDEGGVTQVVWR